MPKQTTPTGRELPPTTPTACEAFEATPGVQQQEADQSGSDGTDVAAAPIPTYEPDDGPLTDAQMDLIRQMVPQGNYRPTRSLFLDLENEIWPPDADKR